MKLLAVYPFHNQEIRIQPLFKIIKSYLMPHIDEHLFIDENSTDKSIHVMRLEYEVMNKNYRVLERDVPTTRGESLITALEFAKSRDIDYIIMFNEGWEDNIYELLSIIRSKEYKDFDLVLSKRNITDISIGSLIDKLTNFIMSLKYRMPIRDTKGDSINLIKVSSFDLTETQKAELKTHHSDYLLKLLSLKKCKIFFTEVENGYNYPGIVTLNTKRLITTLKYFLS